MTAGVTTFGAELRQPLALDHLVINTRFDMTQAVGLFTALGFTLTPRSRHTLGSINHLMVFGTDYLELIGLPDDGGPLREEILNSPCGIDGLVLQDAHADSLAGRLAATAPSLAQALAPVGQFSRPVILPDDVRDASFRTARFAPGHFAAGRVYYCQHLTPELIWRSGWQHHANGARRQSALVIVSADPASDAQAYAPVAMAVAPGRLGEQCWQVQGDGYVLTVCSRDAYRARYGALAIEPEGRTDWFGAIEILVDDLSWLRRVVSEPAAGWHFSETGERIVVQIPAFNAVLDFSTQLPSR